MYLSSSAQNVPSDKEDGIHPNKKSNGIRNVNWYFNYFEFRYNIGTLSFVENIILGQKP